MIKDIFIPRKIGSHYIIPQRIIGIDIGATQISATVIYAHGAKTTIEQCIQQDIAVGSATNYKERVQEALLLLTSKLPRYQQVRTALPSSAVLFKKLKLPFISYEKIKMVLAYEVEPLLPFPVSEAMIDCIITQVFPDEKSSEVFVAAVQNERVMEHLQLFEGTGIHPHIISVDVFALYSLYQHIPQYQELTGSVALIDLGTHETCIIYLYNNVIRFVRTLPKGIVEIARMVSKERSIPFQQVLENIIRFGLEENGDHEYQEALKKILDNFWQEVNFTISSFATQTAQNLGKTHILLVGGGAQIKGITTFVTKALDTPCEQIDLHSLTTHHGISLKKGVSIPPSCILSIGIALPSPLLEHFNLLPKELSKTNSHLIYKQFFAAALLFIAIIGALYGNSMWQLYSLRKEAAQSEQEAIDMLRSKFPQISTDETDLEEANTAANRMLLNEEKVWFAFSSAARASMLTYLLELFTRLDKEALGLTVDKIAIADQTLTLKAEVQDYPELRILERDLRQSPLFVSFPEQQDTSFTMKIKLARTDGEQ